VLGVDLSHGDFLTVIIIYCAQNLELADDMDGTVQDSFLFIVFRQIIAMFTHLSVFG